MTKKITFSRRWEKPDCEFLRCLLGGLFIGR